MSNTLNPLVWACGEENMGGLTKRVAVIPECIVKAMPTLVPKKDAQTDKELATATGAFEFIEAGMTPTVIDATDKTVEYNAENQGEDGGKSFHITGSYFFPGTLAEASAHSRKINNMPCYLVLENFDGQQILVGQPGLPASISPSYAGGVARTDRKGTTYNFEADSIVPYIELATPLDFDELYAIAKGEGAVDPGEG